MTERLTLELTKAAREKMDDIKRRRGLLTDPELFADALAMLDFIWNKHEEGLTIVAIQTIHDSTSVEPLDVRPVHVRDREDKKEDS